MKRLNSNDIEKAAETFLTKHNPENKIPVPIEEIIEFNLGIQIIPRKGLLNLEQIDAFVSKDCTSIYIDEDSYMQQTVRSRFTLAHEVGHVVIHRDLIKTVNNTDEWRKFVLGSGTGRAIYETEANIFAGCLLMPKEEILKAFEKAKDKTSKMFNEQKMRVPPLERIIPYVAVEISKIFEVSDQCATIRLERLLIKSLF